MEMMMAEVEMEMMMVKGDTTVDGDDKQNDAITETDKVQKPGNHMIQGVTSFDTTVDVKPGDPNIPAEIFDPNIPSTDLYPKVPAQILDPNIRAQILDPNIPAQILDPNIEHRLGIYVLQNYMKIQNPFRK